MPSAGNQDRVVGIVTAFRSEDRGIVDRYPSKSFSSSLYVPGRPWVPPNLLFIGYRGLSQKCKSGWEVKQNTDLYLALGLRKSEDVSPWRVILLSSLCCYFTCLMPQHAGLKKLQPVFKSQGWETKLPTDTWQVVPIKIPTLVRAGERRTEGRHHTENIRQGLPTRLRYFFRLGW